MTDMPDIRSDGLQIAEHPQFQKKFWKVERIAWVAFAVIIIVALSGLTGSGGPLSEGKASIGGADVSYPRVARWQTGSRLTVSIVEPPPETVIGFSHPHAARFTIEGVVPEPEAVSSENGRHMYRFAPTREGAAHIVYELTALNPGIATYDIVVGDDRRTITTVILP